MRRPDLSVTMRSMCTAAEPMRTVSSCPAPAGAGGGCGCWDRAAGAMKASASSVARILLRMIASQRLSVVSGPVCLARRGRSVGGGGTDYTKKIGGEHGGSPPLVKTRAAAWRRERPNGRLEDEAEAEAQAAVAAVVVARVGVGAAELLAGVLGDNIGHPEVPVVEDVEGFSAELDLGVLGDVGRLEKKHVRRRERLAEEGVAANVAERGPEQVEGFEVGQPDAEVGERPEVVVDQPRALERLRGRHDRAGRADVAGVVDDEAARASRAAVVVALGTAVEQQAGRAVADRDGALRSRRVAVEGAERARADEATLEGGVGHAVERVRRVRTAEI